MFNYVYVRKCNIKPITVESSLFVGGQCSWLSWEIIAYEFTSSQTYIKAFLILINEVELATIESTTHATHEH